MVSSTIDHMVALTIFLAATLLFIGLFNQTIQTAVIYQNHRATATKASDLLDSMLLNSGTPSTWSRTDASPTGFGLQDPEFTQYKLDAFSLMHLNPSSGASVSYSKVGDSAGTVYSNMSAGPGSYLFMPQASTVNFSSAQKMLGVNGTYGFQLTLTPTITVSISNISTLQDPLTLLIHVEGTGFPLANAQVSYKLFLLSNPYPSFTVINGAIVTDSQGSATKSFNGVSSSQSYAFIASVHLSGLNGVGYCVRSPMQDPYVVPLIGNMSSNQVILAHSDYIEHVNSAETILSYNTTMVNFNSQDFTLQGLQVNGTGDVTNGDGYDRGQVTLSNDPGILIIAYNSTATQGGFSLMPWGLSSLPYTVTFGGDPTNQEWVSTDMRQVTVNRVAYQAQIAIWSYQGIQVNGR